METKGSQASVERQRPIGSGFDARSTADEVLEGIDLTGSTAVVTGGYSGIGIETTRALAGAGASVIVPARRRSLAESALAVVPGTEIADLDLADQASVRAFAEALLRSGRTLDLLIAGAGVMASPLRRVGPGWESQLAINHLGHFALVHRLLPVLNPGSRVVAVSSAGHFLSPIHWEDIQFDRRPYDPWLAYAQSKTANALFALHLDRLGTAHGIHAFSVHPGSILTPLQRHVDRDEQVAKGWIDEDGKAAPGFKDPAQGAATAVWAATSPSLESRGGEYCQDCDIAAMAETDDMAIGGVKPWAVDEEEAARLWAWSAGQTGLDDRERTGSATTVTHAIGSMRSPRPDR